MTNTNKEEAKKIIKKSKELEKQEEINLVRVLKSVNCELLKSGYKKSEMKYFFCKCDPDQKDPICEECAKVCHVGAGHAVTGGQEGKQMCHCGETNHKVVTKQKKQDKLYKPICFFHEWSIISKLNVYYETADKKKICMYCRNFCDYEKSTMTKHIEKKVPNCECDTHTNIKDVFNNINEISSNFNNYEFENLTLIHFTNLLFNCKKSFENIYMPYQTYLTKFREDVMDENFKFDPNIGFSVFSWANSNFSYFVYYTKFFYYFSQNLKQKFTNDYVFRCMEAKFDNQIKAIWTLNYNIFCNFRILTFLGDFSSCPFFKIHDLENLNPLQRLLLVSNVKDNSKIMSEYVNNLNINFLDKIINIIETINNAKEKNSETPFEIMAKMYSMCKVFGKYNLFTSGQITRFCELNDQVVHKFSELRRFLIKNDESALITLISIYFFYF